MLVEFELVFAIDAYKLLTAELLNFIWVHINIGFEILKIRWCDYGKKF